MSESPQGERLGSRAIERNRFAARDSAVPLSPSDVVAIESGVGGWVRLCRAADVGEDAPLGVVLVAAEGEEVADLRRVGDRDKVCVARDGDRWVALMDRCPHRDIRLSGGVAGEGLLTCPGHFWRFSLSDGRRTDKPDEVATVYPTRVDADGWVWAQLPPRPPAVSMRAWLLDQARSRP